MGIQNRDYMQDEAPRGFGRQGRPMEVVKTLIIINVVVYVIQLLLRGEMENWFALESDAVLKGQVWRLLTYDFLHDASDSMPLHLLFNMWLLYMAGTRVEWLLGGREFLAFYLLAGVLSGVFFLLWGWLTNTQAAAIGASGAVIAVLIVYALNWPQERWLIFGIIPMPVIWIAGITALFDLFPMLQQLSGRNPGGNIAHAAHMGGILFGLLYVTNRWHLTGQWGGRGHKWSNPFRRRPKLRVLHPELEEDRADASPIDQERLDQLLEKISAQGEASLTSEERRFLTETSRRIRQRE